MTRRETAKALMEAFLARDSRYLWTDAYAVRNLLKLGETEQALALIATVHRKLGRHRPDDKRQGWLSPQGEEHPTRGGLRIGKPLPERRPDEEFDRRLEWERDGQYFHYLTRWAEALGEASSATGDTTYRNWARELMETAGRAFLIGTPPNASMVWKKSIDLSRVLVPSMGHHDPLDGLVTCLALGGLDTSAYRSLLESQDLATTDPLGIGGLLSAAARLQGLSGEDALRERVIRAALSGLKFYKWGLEPEATPRGRLGFRELGLAIGIRSCGDDRLDPYRERTNALIAFWSREQSRPTTAAWREHRDINEVMLVFAWDLQEKRPA